MSIKLATYRSSPLASARLASARLASTRLASTRLASTRLASARRRLFATLALVLAFLAVPAAEATCLNAIFFDLGDTLVEDGGGGQFVLRAGAQETVDALQAAGLQLGVITNVPAGWTRDDLEAILEDPDFLDEFDVLVLSSQAPAPKPDPLIYTHAHGLLPTAVPIGETAFVGETLGEIADSETSPTEGARSVGMVGIWLSDGQPNPIADHTIPPDQLLDIVDLRETLCAVFADGFETGDTVPWSSTVP